MKGRCCLALAALLVGMLGWFAVPLSASAAPPSRPKWTFMVYIDGDNNLERYVTLDIETELAQPGSNADVHVVALADRIPGYDNSAGDWTTTKLFYITPGMQATPENALADWGERNMGDPETLREFIQWAKTNHTADHYALILWDHGWGWRPYQTMWDETDNDSLDQHEILSVLQEVGGVDVVGYDACEQQMIEVETTWRGYAEAIAASQQDVGWNGFEYDQVLTALQANPNMTGADLAVELARSMQDWTSAAVALNAAWDTLLAAVDAWSIALLNGLPTYQSAYDQAYKFTQAMADPTNKDLYDAAKEIKARVNDPGIQAASQAVMDAVTAVTLYEWHKKGYKDAHGIGIFWPRTRADLDEPSSPQNDFEYYRTLLFAQRTHWDEFIAVYADRDR